MIKRQAVDIISFFCFVLKRYQSVMLLPFTGFYYQGV